MEIRSDAAAGHESRRDSVAVGIDGRLRRRVPPGPVVLAAEHVSKSFAGVSALRDVDFDLRRGEVHALMGENGAGKSTLMKILAGVHTAYEGAVRVEGRPASFGGVRDAEAAVREASAVLDNVRLDVNRRRDLFRETVISRAELDKSEEQLGVAQARLDSARERLSLIEAGAREEERAHADAEVALARAALDEARAVLEKTYVRSPIDGVVFRRFRKAGESVSTQFDAPIVTLADRSWVRVRVDVDEGDVADLRVGQPAYVTADAFGDRRFAGRIVRVGQMLGRKNVRTDEPTERVDTKILETLVELDDGRELPLGLRVQAFILGK